LRTAGWLLLSAPYILVIILMMSPRQDLSLKFLDARYVIEQFAALAAGISAAVAAFATVVPGYSRRLLILPLMSVGIWMGTVGQGCIQEWMQRGPEGLVFRPDWMCLPVIALFGAVPALAIAVMLRRGAPLTPHLTAALGGLAAAGLGNFGLRFVHTQDASVMVLVWQLGSVFILSALAGWVGHLLLSWRSITALKHQV
ncbi:MAG: DUF1109 domain-containing protein, partial [Acidobacteriales bacterium]|nr:DUF1109 domain-containing protein [Terriglobales bacterium]